MSDKETTSAPARKGRAKAPDTNARTKTKAAPPPREVRPSRLDQLQELITRDGGASIAEMIEATGWQQHSVRGAMAGALKKRGFTITSEKVEGVRRYRAAAGE